MGDLFPLTFREKIMQHIKLYIDDLYWEYDRMSSSGKETLDKIARKIGLDMHFGGFTRYYFNIDAFTNPKSEKDGFQGMYVYLKNKEDLQKDFQHNVGIMHDKNDCYSAMVDRTDYISNDLSEIEHHVLNFIKEEKIYG